MKIKPSEGPLTGGLVLLGIGVLFLCIRTTDSSGFTANPTGPIGFFFVIPGMIFLVMGVFRLARNVDLAAATIVDGPEAAQRMSQPRDVRLRSDLES